MNTISQKLYNGYESKAYAKDNSKAMTIRNTNTVKQTTRTDVSKDLERSKIEYGGYKEPSFDTSNFDESINDNTGIGGGVLDPMTRLQIAIEQKEKDAKDEPNKAKVMIGLGLVIFFAVVTYYSLKK